MARRALCVGINTYPTAPLSGCVADARNWAGALSGFESTLLLDGQATRENILRNLSDLVTNAKRGDILVFQYSGHGTQLPDLDGDEADAWDEAMCPVDFHLGNFITDDDLFPLTSSVQDGVSLTVLMDCCFSGTNTRFAAGGLPGLGREKDGWTPRYVAVSTSVQPRGNVPPRRNPEDMRHVAISACTSDEVAYEVNGQGMFTVRAVQVLKGGKSLSNIGFVTAVEDAFGERPPQHPRLDCPKPDRTKRFLSGRR